jgi:hypothetical protein
VTTTTRPDPSGPRFFFVKIMKTGGATFLQHILANFARDEVYPYEPLDHDMQRANIRIDALTGLSQERRDRIRVYTGHFPFVAAQLLSPDLVTLTILRDPIERTISYLKHCKRYHEQHRDLPLEAIYEDPFFFACFIHNHQAKLFALTAPDRPESYMDTLEVDDDRLAIAQANLEHLDVIGFQDRFDELLEQMQRRFGWVVGSVPNRHVGEVFDVAASFRRRIADDNAADVAFYEFARALDARRSVTS